MTDQPIDASEQTLHLMRDAQSGTYHVIASEVAGEIDRLTRDQVVWLILYRRSINHAVDAATTTPPQGGEWPPTSS